MRVGKNRPREPIPSSKTSHPNTTREPTGPSPTQVSLHVWVIKGSSLHTWRRSPERSVGHQGKRLKKHPTASGRTSRKVWLPVCSGSLHDPQKMGSVPKMMVGHWPMKGSEGDSRFPFRQKATLRRLGSLGAPRSSICWAPARTNQPSGIPRKLCRVSASF